MAGMNILILGLGNILMSDEGVGVRAIEALMARGNLPADVEVVDGGTSGMELLELMMKRDLIIVADAISAERRVSGDIIRLDGADLDQFFRQRMSPHQIGLSDVLAALHLMDAAPGRLVLFGVVPESLELGLELTPPVSTSCDRVAELIEAEVAALFAPEIVSVKRLPNVHRHPA